jgi:hypothetical protein
MKTEHWWKDSDKRKLKYLEKNLSQCHLSTTNPTWAGLETNLGLHGDRPVTKMPES